MYRSRKVFDVMMSLNPTTSYNPSEVPSAVPLQYVANMFRDDILEQLNFDFILGEVIDFFTRCGQEIDEFTEREQNYSVVHLTAPKFTVRNFRTPYLSLLERFVTSMQGVDDKQSFQTKNGINRHLTFGEHTTARIDGSLSIEYFDSCEDLDYAMSKIINHMNYHLSNKEFEECPAAYYRMFQCFTLIALAPRIKPSSDAGVFDEETEWLKYVQPYVDLVASLRNMGTTKTVEVAYA